VHMMLHRQLPDRQPIDPRVASDRGEQLHPRPHHLRPPSVITSRSMITVKRGQIKPSQPPQRVGKWGQIRLSQPSRNVVPVEPLQTVTVGPTQAVTAS
jgi:hypothetical protein